MRIIFLTKDALLGDLNIQVNTAIALKRMNPAFEFLFVTDSDFTDFFYRKKIRFARVPGNQEGVENSGAMIEIIKAFKPQIVFFNKKVDEVLAFNRKQGILNFLLTPDGSEEGFDRQFLLKDKPIVKEERIKKISYLKPGFKVLITAGSGTAKNTEEFIDESLKACRGLKAQIIIVPGPLFKNYAKYSGYILKRYEPNFLSLINNVDVVVTLPNYNTLAEAVYLKKRIVVYGEDKYFKLPDHKDDLHKAIINAKPVKEHKFNEIYKEIHTAVISEKPYQTLNLANKTLTSALAGLEVKKKTFYIDFQKFSWYDLLLVLEYLKNKGVKYFYLELHHENIPVLKKLKRYNIVYIVNEKLKKELEEGYIPAVLKGTSLLSVPLYYELLREKINKELEEIKNRKGKLLLKKHIEVKHLVLTNRREYINAKLKPLDNDKIKELEFEKNELLEEKKIKDEYLSINQEIEKLQKEIDDYFNRVMKTRMYKNMSLEYEIYLLLKKHKLIKIRDEFRANTYKLNNELNDKWKEINKIDKEIKELQNKLNNFKEYSSVVKKLGELNRERDSLWNKYNELEKDKEDKTAEFYSHDIPEIQKIKQLEEKKRNTEKQFNELLNEKFNPIRRKLAEAESMNSKDVPKLRAEKETVWKKFLAPLEKEIDVLTVKINNIELTEKAAEIIKLHVDTMKNISNEQKEIIDKVNKINNEIEELNAKEGKLLNHKIKTILNKIAELEKQKEAINKEAKRVKEKIKQWENKFEQEIRKEGIFDEYKKLLEGIKEIKPNDDYKKKQDYLNFLKQKLAYLLDKNGILERINEIDSEISRLYRRDEKTEQELKDVEFAIVKLLKTAGIYKKWRAFEDKEKKLNAILNRLAID